MHASTLIYNHRFGLISALIYPASKQSASRGAHTDSRGRFVLELNDGSTWIIYSSDKDLELSYVAATSDRPSS